MDLHVHAAGSGETGTILFLHGFPFDASIWDAQLAGLPAGWRGLAPDLRGFGRSPLGADELPSGKRLGGGVALPTEAVLTMDILADDVASLIERHAAGRAVLCALSMGGYIALALVKRRPELVRGLILMDTRPGPDGDEARENRRRMAATVRDAGPRPIAAVLLPSLLSSLTRERNPDAVEKIRALVEGTPPRTVIAALAGMTARRDATAGLPDIDVPTLVVVGEDDTITPPADARAMADAIPGARLEVVPGAAHLPCVEAPDVVNRLIADFLTQDAA